MRPASICFVAPHALGALEARFGQPSSRGFGGAEVQMALLAAGFAERGHRITFLCHRPEAGSATVEAGPVRVIQTGPSGSAAVPAFLGYWRAQHQALKALGPDLVYQRCGLPLTGITAWSCRRLGIPFVFAVANDRDLDGRGRRALGVLQHACFRYGLRRADLVVVQTSQQASLLVGATAAASARVPSAVELPDRVTPAPEPPVVLWVSSLLRKKQPFEFLRIARALPDVQFVAAAPTATEPDTAARFAAGVRELRNVDWRDRVPYAEMDPLYRSGAVLLNTSAAEGVPNTFLEAWARGRPVFSLSVDPDAIITRRGLGKVVRDEEPATLLRSFLANPAERRAAGEAGRRFVREEHDLPAVIARYEACLAPLIHEVG